MNLGQIATGTVSLLLLSACTYDGLRLQERARCGAMPDSLARNCYARTQTTQAEYATQLRRLPRSADEPAANPDPRYKEWLP
jgi:hypothetical protein